MIFYAFQGKGIYFYVKNFSHFRPILSFSVILNLFQDLIGILKQVQHDKMGRSVSPFSETNLSTIHPFNPPHPSHLTLHFPVRPLTRISKFAALIKKFYPLPQGARELFCSKPFTLSTFQPFNFSTVQHSSPFTLHASLC